MPENINNLSPEATENNRPEEQFESDTQRIVHRHLADENDIITEEDIRSIRIGMSPPVDAPMETFLEEHETGAKDRNKIDDGDSTLPGEQKITPWDVVDPNP